MKNIEIFESQTAEIFKVPYESFPVPKDIYFHQISPEPKPVDGFGETLSPPENEGEFDDFYQSFDLFEQCSEYRKNSTVFSSTIEWLQSSGYISFERMGSFDCFQSVVLTAKGLEVLKGTPSCLDGSLTLGEKLQDEVVATGSDMARDLVKQALREGLRIAVGM
ncbi:hypothetical protein L1D14_26530 [Vibrio tubiashii]|uniref:hypothetical protein n=1 Tax=Vibrio tubiashii TaxID=29498 RepID=UPI001EFDF445|nr:hypothetical protein [Vibrio tubiashii]MCG9579764.1 hypothetical protein [Vibrio tubiashii]